MEEDFLTAYEAAHYDFGYAAGKRVRAILREADMPIFCDWIEEKHSRLNMMLLDPEEAAYAFLALRYERWR